MHDKVKEREIRNNAGQTTNPLLRCDSVSFFVSLETVGLSSLCHVGVATCTDIHRHPARNVDTLRLVGATVTIVYITPTQMKVMAQCGAHNTRFLSDPEWPRRRIFQAYLRTFATKARRTMPGPKDIDAAYKAFQHKHPRPRPKEHKAPNDAGMKREEPTPSGEGWAPPTILLLASNGHKHATRTVQRHRTPWSIPKHNAPETDVPPVRHDDPGTPRMCWHCGPAALDTTWPLLHLISTHYHTPTAATTADQQAWLSPWHSNPRPPSARSLESKTHGRMGIHQRAGKPRKHSHRVRPLQPTPCGPS